MLPLPERSLQLLLQRFRPAMPRCRCNQTGRIRPRWSLSSLSSSPTNSLNCSQTLPWFYPLLFAQPSSSLLQGAITATDEGTITSDGSTLEQVRYCPAAEIQGAVYEGSVRHEYDAPGQYEYHLHGDRDFGQTIRVRVAFSNYEIVSGIPSPRRLSGT